MKKAIYTLLMTAAVVMSIVACQKKDDGNQASTPTVNCNIPGNTSCNPGEYEQYGLTQYGAYNGGLFCNCPIGTRPVMNTQWGLSCAPDLFFTSYQQYNYNFQFGAYPSSVFNMGGVTYYQSQNLQWTSIRQEQFRPVNNYGSVSTCYSYAASVCNVSLNGTNGINPQCITAGGSAGTCMQAPGYSGPASGLGVCSNSTMNTGGYYGGGYNGGYYNQNQTYGCIRYVGGYPVNVCTNTWGSGGGYTNPR